MTSLRSASSTACGLVNFRACCRSALGLGIEPCRAKGRGIAALSMPLASPVSRPCKAPAPADRRLARFNNAASRTPCRVGSSSSWPCSNPGPPGTAPCYRCQGQRAA